VYNFRLLCSSLPDSPTLQKKQWIDIWLIKLHNSIIIIDISFVVVWSPVLSPKSTESYASVTSEENNWPTVVIRHTFSGHCATEILASPSGREFKVKDVSNSVDMGFSILSTYISPTQISTNLGPFKMQYLYKHKLYRKTIGT